MGAQLWKIEKTVKKGDYIYAVVRAHPKATKHGYVLEHRIIMENHLGRLLNSNEIVHHKIRGTKDNALDNLELKTLPNHSREHGLLKGRKMVKLKCPGCKSIFIRRHGNTHLCKGGHFTACSGKCRGIFSRHEQLHGKTKLVKIAISENVIEEFRFYENAEERPTGRSVETIRDQPETAKT